MSKLYHGFLDESGILESKAFIVAIIIVGNPAEIKDVIKNARQKNKGKFRTRGIFKTSRANPSFAKTILIELAKKNINIIVGAWNNKNNKKIEKNILYAKLLAQTISLALAKYPKLNLTIHKRYTLPRIQNQIKQIIIQNIKSGNFLSIDQRTETECRELELADAVAWAVYQKYNNKKSEFYEIIKNKIVKENRLTA